LNTVIFILHSLLCTIDLPQTYEEIYNQALYNCGGTSVPLSEERESVMKDLISVEKNFFLDHPEIPRSLRGMSIAAACIESRYNPQARGDWRTNKRGKRVAKAHGVLQLWPWWVKKYKIDRDDYIKASNVWLEKIAYQYQKNKRLRRCPTSFSEKRKWIAAWVQTTRGNVNRQNRYRCYQMPSHYNLLKRWIRNIERERININTECGC
jgi:hypothetical protein